MSRTAGITSIGGGVYRNGIAAIRARSTCYAGGGCHGLPACRARTRLHVIFLGTVYCTWSEAHVDLLPFESFFGYTQVAIALYAKSMAFVPEFSKSLRISFRQFSAHSFEITVFPVFHYHIACICSSSEAF